ncbi:MAG: DegV family protein [Chloroflexi bacterium]|nr:MAG: DegV family protein [Chloroflexota bacterium]
MAKVAIVTDSTAYIPKELVGELNITVAPQLLIWGEETFRDGVDIHPDDFYRRLSIAKVMPSTSQVTPAYFYEIFKRKLDEGFEVMAVLVSEQLSGTLASARQAIEMLPESPVEFYDSRTTAMAMGFQVLGAARMAKEGATRDEIRSYLDIAREHVGVVFAVDTLEFLHRGGRIGGGARFLATALNIKPILEVTGGRVEAVERIRTRKKSLERLLEIIEERTAGKQPVRLATLHANARAEACDLIARANGNLNAVETIISEVSPVVGTHAGPGTVGLAYMAGM